MLERESETGKNSLQIGKREMYSVHPFHGISVVLDILFAQRARTKRRSDKRLRYTRTPSPISSLRESLTTVRSARRQTVRARWRCEAMGDPPGRMKDFRGCSRCSVASI